MRSQLFVLVAAFAIGCGGGGSSEPDAKVFMDAPPPDAPTPLMGLGQACSQGMNNCPMNAPLCILNQAGKGFCTLRCITDGTFMTNAQSQPGNFNPVPTSQDAMCPPIFTGTVGTARCAVPFNLRPNEQLMANKTYMIDWACGIQCGAGNACPTGLTCNTQTMICDPA